MLTLFKWIRIHPHFFYLLAIIASPYSFASQNDAISPIVPSSVDLEKAKLGKQLFEDKVFSKDNSLSCASCHALPKAGCDNLPTYIGLHKKPGLLNTPTVLNASLNFRQFWDGRVKSLENVIDDHIENETVFANNWPKIEASVKSSTEYTGLFKTLYSSSNANADMIKNALVNYLNVLYTPDSPFDKFLQGDKSALSSEAQKGYELFQQYGCITCHQGPNIGGNLFQPLGIYKNYFADKGYLTHADLGRFNVTKREQDKFVFKVPSLRNIALTGPYLHDGSVKTLDEVVKIMGTYQVGQEIPNYDIPFIVKFLESLSGKIPESLNEQDKK